MASAAALRAGLVIVSYSPVPASQVIPLPAPRGDSRGRRDVSRASAAEAVFGRVSALVASAAAPRLRPGDRSVLRLLAALVAVVLAPFRRLARRIDVARPDAPCSITQRATTAHPASVRPRPVRRGPATHPHTHRAAAAESPDDARGAVPDETRDPDQFDPAGDPGRHPRGRRAR